MFLILIFFISNGSIYAMSPEEEDAYKRMLWEEGSRLQGRFNLSNWERGVVPTNLPGLDYAAMLNEQYGRLPLKRLWRERGYSIVGPFVKHSPSDMGDIKGNDDLNLLVVQAEHLGLSGIELRNLVVEKFPQAALEELLKAIQLAAFLERKGEYCYYLDQLYQRRNEQK